MSAGNSVHYSWPDEANNCTQDLCAIDYMYNTVTWGFEKLTDPTLIPRDGGKTPIPHERFYNEVRTIMRRFFRVYAHAYLSHFGDLRAVGGEQGKELEGCLNFCFKHFIFIAKEFDLVEEADMVPLSELIVKFLRQDDERVSREQILRPLPPRSQEGSQPSQVPVVVEVV